MRDKKAVENAVQALADGEFEIVLTPVFEDEATEEAAEATEESPAEETAQAL